MRRYFLSNGAHFCGRGDTIVFLDLKNDRYSMVRGAQARAVRIALSDAETIVGDESLGAAAGFTESTLEELVAAEVLTEDVGSGKPFLPADTRMPSTRVGLPSDPASSAIRLQHVWFFLLACITAVFGLRFVGIAKIVDRIRRRKALGARGPINWDEVRDLTSVFNQLRALFPANYLCIFDSFALIEFLAHYRVFPTWTFAVQFDPWEAHCWVELAGVSLNEDVDHTENFTPIMTV